MLDRTGLSAKNGWLDEENRVYIVYTIAEIMEDLNCADQKAGKLLSELDTVRGIGLIERKRQGLGKPNIIYVKNFYSASRLQRSENHESRNFRKTKVLMILSNIVTRNYRMLKNERRINNMQLKIEMYDVKDEMIFDTEKIFAHGIIQEVDGYYCVPVVFEVFDEDENEVATITAYFLDERKIADNGLEISTVADMFSQDLYNVVNTLKKSENYSDICSKAYTCYIETLYVYPMFRGLGIGKYLWEKIADIFEYFTNRNIHTNCNKRRNK